MFDSFSTRPNRTFVLLALLAWGCVAPGGGVSAGPGTKVPDASYPVEFQASVKQAIRRGVEHLRTKQLIVSAAGAGSRGLGDAMEGVDYEGAAAVMWVLRRAGVAKDDPAFRTAGTKLRSRPPATVDEAALVILGLTASSLEDGNPFTIEETTKGKPGTQGLDKDDRALVETAMKLIFDHQVTAPKFAGLGAEFDDTGGWGREIGGRRSPTADVPTIYMALLALESAARAGLPVPASVYSSALALLVRWQTPKGRTSSLKMNEVRGKDRFEWSETAQIRGFGWCGTMSDIPTGFDTVAGTVGLVICQDALQKDKSFTKDLRKKARVGIRDALAWVQQNYDIKVNPVPDKTKLTRDIAGELYHHHWLQGLARLAIHARMRFVGPHDWYQEGAEELVKTQKEGGNWSAIWWSNCYALLFLMRASLPSITPVVTVSEGDSEK